VLRDVDIVGHEIVCLSQLPPSALEHPETVLRDPVTYQVYKRMDHFFQKYLDRLPHYTHEQVSVIITVCVNR
jgi:hypothetical protein